MNTQFFVKEWIIAWKAVWARGWYLPFSAVLDLLFLVLYGFMTSPVFDKLTEHIIVIGALVSEQMSVADRARPAVIDALFQEPVSKYTWQFLGLLVLLAIVVFVLYCIIQGVAWLIAGKLVNSKMHWRQYLLCFIRINLVWAGLYFLWQCIDTLLSLRNLVVEKITGQPVISTDVFMIFLLVILFYFALVSYPLLAIKKAFLVGTKKLFFIIPAMIVVVLQFFIANYVVKKLGEISPKFGFIIGVIIVLLLLGWSRAYITFVVRRTANV